MKILYVHGFGSQYDPTHEKIQALETLGTVVGVNVDYCAGFQIAYQTVLDQVIGEDIDLIVGTSMGGYMAAHVGNATGTPFVALNPATTPSETLKKWLGTFVNYTGTSMYLSASAAESYPDIVQEGCGLVVVEYADEVIHAWDTVKLLKNVFHVEGYQGGSHRFSNMTRVLPLISKHYEMAQLTYGN